MGHWNHHRGKSFSCRSEDIGNQARLPNDPERVADKYAADLIMPLYMFKSISDDFTSPTLKTIEDLAKIFNTSFLAMAIRYAEFASFPCMLVCHGQKGLKWFVQNRNIENNLYLQKELDHESLAFEVVFGSKSETRKSKIGADAWINMNKSDRCEISEETKAISADSAITLLTFHDQKLLDLVA